MKPFTINNEQQRIEFIDNRFYRTPNGYVPSVTTILEAYPKDAQFFKWLKENGQEADNIRDEAGRRGSVVHELTERYDCNELVTFINQDGYPKYKMAEWSMFERYVEFTETHKPVIDIIELHMASDELGFAGTLDRVINLNGKNILIDIKTSNAIHNTYWLQLAAYMMLLLEHSNKKAKIDEVGILWLNAKTRTAGKKGDIQGKGWQLVTKPIEELNEYWELFKVTKTLWNAINEDMKPKELFYKLSHKK